jgi:hypothetical protein
MLSNCGVTMLTFHRIVRCLCISYPVFYRGFCFFFSGHMQQYQQSQLQSQWDRAYLALHSALSLYRERHPGQYATIIIDEPTDCFPKCMSDSPNHSAVGLFKRQVLNDLAALAVYYGCDQKAAHFVFATSSSAARALTST